MNLSNQTYKKYTYSLPYVAIALLIMGPLLTPGYILTLDMVFVPHPALLAFTNPNFVVSALFHFVSFVLPMDLVQKLILTSILIFSGVGMHSLVRSLHPKVRDMDWRIACYFAGMLYMVNPFVFSRFMAGQYLILAGYAMMPFVTRAAMAFLGMPTRRAAMVLLAWLLSVSLVSIHMLGVSLLLVAGLAVFALNRNARSHAKWRSLVVRRSALIAGAFLALSSYWLLPFILHKSSSADLIGGFTNVDRSAFATNGEQLGVLGNVLALHGFWGDVKNLYVTSQESYGWWYVPLVVLLLLVGAGIYKSWSTRRNFTIALIVVGIIAIILACGTVGGPFTAINTALTKFVPFFSGYREPQKFVAVLVLLYAYFGGFGLAAVVARIKRPAKEYALIAACIGILMPLLYAPLMLWGFHGELRAAQYPVEWYAIHDRLHADKDAKAVFLPWHEYMRISFAGRIVSNPADRFFATTIVSSNDPEMSGIKGWKNNADQNYVEQIFLPALKAGKKNLGAGLHARGIDYVLLAKEFDYKKYDLSNQKDLTLVQDSPTLQLYQVSSTVKTLPL